MPDESPSGKDGYASKIQGSSGVIREVSLVGMLPRFQVLCLPLLRKFGRSRSPEFSTESPAEIHLLVTEEAVSPHLLLCNIDQLPAHPYSDRPWKRIRCRI